ATAPPPAPPPSPESGTEALFKPEPSPPAETAEEPEAPAPAEEKADRPAEAPEEKADRPAEAPEEKREEDSEEDAKSGILGRTVGAILGGRSGEEGEGKPVEPVSEAEKTKLNEASFEELRELGFSVTQATRLLTYRERQGGFDSLDDLDSVPGIPDDLLNEIKPKLRL
ncbi:MAG: ComEA family DNA-binding protein, partial [Solirubrobacterales bacterium]